MIEANENRRYFNVIDASFRDAPIGRLKPFPPCEYVLAWNRFFPDENIFKCHIKMAERVTIADHAPG